MAIRIDWKRSLIMSLVLIVILYALQFVITDREVYYMVFIGLFVVIMLMGNVLFRRRRY